MPRSLLPWSTALLIMCLLPSPASSEPWHWEYRPRATPAPEPGKDCLGSPQVPREAPAEVARPSPR